MKGPGSLTFENLWQLGGGGILGSGSQYFSWVSLGDVVAAITFILNTPSLKGTSPPNPTPYTIHPNP